MPDYTILLIEPVHTVRQKLRLALENSNYKVLEAGTYEELSIGIKTKYNHVDLIVLDFEVKDTQGNRALTWLKKINIKKPIIVLSGDNRRSVIFEAIQSGAADIIIRPFEESILVTKIDKMLSTLTSHPNEDISFNMPQLIEKECIRAKKGKYVFSMAIATFINPETINSPNFESEHYRLSSKIFQSLNQIFFETDYFFQFGSQSFIGLFLFCDTENSKIIEEKMNKTYNKLSESISELQNYIFVSTFSTFPTDYEALTDYTQLLPVLTERLKKSIDQLLNQPADNSIDQKDVLSYEAKTI